MCSFNVGGEDANFIAAVVERWRNATMKATPEETFREAKSSAAETAGFAAPIHSSPALSPAAPVAPAAPAAALDPSRFSLLKKPIAERSDFSFLAARRSGGGTAAAPARQVTSARGYAPRRASPVPLADCPSRVPDGGRATASLRSVELNSCASVMSLRKNGFEK